MIPETERLKDTALRIKPLLGPAERLGVAEDIIDLYVGVTDRYDLLERVDDRIANYELSPSDREGYVLVPFMHAENWIANLLNLSMAHVFRTRGYEPVVPMCYKTLPLCTKKQFKSDDVSTCAMCHHETSAWLDAFGIEPVYLTDVLPDRYEPATFEYSPDLQSYAYEGVDVMKYAKSTTRKFLRRHRLDYTDETEMEYLCRFISAGVELVDATDAILDQWDVDAVMSHHSGYLYGGVILETARERGYPASILSPQSGHREGVLLVGNMRNRQTLPAYAAEEAVRDRITTPLTDEEQAAIDEYLAGRRDGSTIPSNKHYTEGSQAELDVADHRTHIGVFTNLMWDASLIDSHDVFNSPFSWVMTTIELLGGRDDVRLTIKPHPAEAVRHSNDKMADWVRRNVDPIPENVTVLDPDTDISPYKMMSTLDLGVVYNSTLGLEMVYDRIPVIVAGDAHYRGFGFTTDPRSPSEYVDALELPASFEVTDEMQTKATRYAHYFFLERLIEVPLFQEAGSGEMQEVRHAELAPPNERFDYVVERILADDRAISYPPRGWEETDENPPTEARTD